MRLIVSGTPLFLALLLPTTTKCVVSLTEEPQKVERKLWGSWSYSPYSDKYRDSSYSSWWWGDSSYNNRDEDSTTTSSTMAEEEEPPMEDAKTYADGMYERVREKCRYWSSRTRDSLQHNHDEVEALKEHWKKQSAELAEYCARETASRCEEKTAELRRAQRDAIDNVVDKAREERRSFSKERRNDLAGLFMDAEETVEKVRGIRDYWRSKYSSSSWSGSWWDRDRYSSYSSWWDRDGSSSSSWWNHDSDSSSSSSSYGDSSHSDENLAADSSLLDKLDEDLDAAQSTKGLVDDLLSVANEGVQYEEVCFLISHVSVPKGLMDDDETLKINAAVTASLELTVMDEQMDIDIYGTMAIEATLINKEEGGDDRRVLVSKNKHQNRHKNKRQLSLADAATTRPRSIRTRKLGRSRGVLAVSVEVGYTVNDTTDKAISDVAGRRQRERKLFFRQDHESSAEESFVVITPLVFEMTGIVQLEKDYELTIVECSEMEDYSDSD